MPASSIPYFSQKMGRNVKPCLNSTRLNEHLWTQVLKHLNVHIYLVTIAYRYYALNHKKT